jgi:hypothetical protein
MSCALGYCRNNQCPALWGIAETTSFAARFARHKRSWNIAVSQLELFPDIALFIKLAGE